MKHEATQSDAASVAGLSRRREVRISPPADVTVSIEGMPGNKPVRDLSYGGLSFVTPTPIRLRSIHTATVEMGSVSVRVRARTVHCSRQPAGGWLIGLEFMAEMAGQRWGTDDVVNMILTAAITFA